MLVELRRFAFSCRWPFENQETVSKILTRRYSCFPAAIARTMEKAMKKIDQILLVGSQRFSPAETRVKVTPPSKKLHFYLHLSAGCNLLPELARKVADGEIAAFDADQLLAVCGEVSQQILDEVSDTLRNAGFTVGKWNPYSRLLAVEGTARQIRRSFGATLNEYEGPDGLVFTGRNGQLSIPKDWSIASYVQSVHGIDQRPKAKPRHVRFLGPIVLDKKAEKNRDTDDNGRQKPREKLARSWNARAVAEHYGVPLTNQGAGYTVGFVSLGGGLDPRVVARANARLGLPAPKITIITVDGARNKPSGDLEGADGENYLDSQVQAAVAPLAEQIMSIGPNSVTGFANALLALARHDKKPSKISISWGAREDGEWTDNDRVLFDQALQTCMAMGITVFCAAGDDGSSDGASDGKSHCDYPGSSPWNSSCSGVFDNGFTVRAWNSTFGGATGGGVSGKYLNYTSDQLVLQASGVKLPVHADTGSQGRVVGDVAGIADPATGIEVLGPQGSVSVIGGTSAVSPFHAAACVALESDLGRKIGNLNALVYKFAASGKHVCVAVTKGNNGAYSCRDGDIFNAVCGLGTIDYKKFFQALQ